MKLPVSAVLDEIMVDRVDEDGNVIYDEDGQSYLVPKKFTRKNGGLAAYVAETTDRGWVWE